MKQKVVIVGAGQAGYSAAARLRELDPGTDITIVGEEPHFPYQRPPLSKKYVTGEMTADRLLLRPQEWYGENNVTCLTGSPVTNINRNENSIQLENGQLLEYSTLLLTTGCRPRNLPAAIGGELEGVFAIRSISHVDALTKKIKPGGTVLVVGGGYIGLEAASVFNKLGMKVHVLEMAERILQRVAGKETSGFVRSLHNSHGVEIHESTGLKFLSGQNGHVTSATFDDGTSLNIELALVGIGVVPNCELAESAGLVCDNGINVDQHCRTNDPNIYAAGDCSNFEFQGKRIRLESVQNAIDQAICAATNIAGEKKSYQPTPWFWSDQYDLKLQIAGLNTGYDQTIVRPGTREGTQSVWYFRESEFVSVDSMNDPRAYMVGKKLLETGGRITPEQAADVGVDLKMLLTR